jgi:hypothetical protein
MICGGEICHALVIAAFGLLQAKSMLDESPG